MRRGLVLTALTLTLASCQSHGVQLLEEKVGRSLARFRDSADPRPYVASEVRRLGKLRDTTVRLMPGGPQDRLRMRQGVDRARDLVYDETAPAVRRTADSARVVLTREVDRTQDLVGQGAIWRELLSPWRARRRLDRAVQNIPALLDLDRSACRGRPTASVRPRRSRHHSGASRGSSASCTASACSGGAARAGSYSKPRSARGGPGLPSPRTPRPASSGRAPDRRACATGRSLPPPGRAAPTPTAASPGRSPNASESNRPRR